MVAHSGANKASRRPESRETRLQLIYMWGGIFRPWQNNQCDTRTEQGYACFAELMIADSSADLSISTTCTFKHFAYPKGFREPR